MTEKQLTDTILQMQEVLSVLIEKVNFIEKALHEHKILTLTPRQAKMKVIKNNNDVHSDI